MKSIMDDVRAAAEEIETGEPPAAPAIESKDAPADAPEETAEQAEARARDEKGRFAKGEKQPTLTLDKPLTKPLEKPLDKPLQGKPDATVAEQAKGEQIAPPVDWKGAAKVRWDRLPREIQQELVTQHQALAEQRASLEPVQRAIEPYREVFVRDAGSIESAVAQLGQFYQAYLTNPIGLIQHIARTRGIDLGAPAGQQPQGQPQQAPDVQSLIRQAVQQQMQPIQAQFEQAEAQQITSVIDAFRADNRHPYFEDVRVHMGQLIHSGVAKSMEEAYEQAVWANPVIRQQLTSAQAESQKAQQASETEKARKAAAASVRGAPLPGVNGAGSKPPSIRDAVRQAFDEVSGS